MPVRKPLLLGFGCPDGVQVGWGVSEVLAAFCTTLAAMYGTATTGRCGLNRGIFLQSRGRAQRCLESRGEVDLNHRPLGYECRQMFLSC